MLIFMTFISYLSSLHEYPILIAVSCLSPVSTHTFIPAFISVAMVSGTSFYILSSIAVAPIKTIPCSISSATYASRFDLSDIAFFAFSHCLSNSSASSLVNSFLANTRVLRPYIENSCKCLFSYSFSL